MKPRKNLDEKERWEVEIGMCYQVMTDMLPGPENILKFTRCNCKKVLMQQARKDAPIEELDCSV